MIDTSNKVFCHKELKETKAKAILNATPAKYAPTLHITDTIITHNINDDTLSLIHEILILIFISKAFQRCGH
eukprot:9229747-Ditylum_brightwellii.AAC.1